VGIVLPIYFFGSPAHMLDRVIAARPHDFIVGDWTAKNGKLWFYSTMVLTSLGFFCGSAPIAATYSAKSEGTLRRNAIFLPLYSLMMLPIFFAGYTASLVLPGLHGQAADTAYLHVLQSKFPAALLGIVCSAGALAGLIPFASRLLSTSSLLTKNVLDDLFGARLEGAGLTWATRIGILVIASGSLVLWLFVKASLVDLLLFAYNGSTQVAPALLYGLFWKRASLWPIAIGLSAGVIIAVILTVHAVPTAGLNPGFVALAVNFALTTALILWWPRPHQALPTAPSAEHR
jgi:SSS family solute:Na+ symporter